MRPVDRRRFGWHQVQRGVQALERSAGIVKMNVAVIDRAAVVGAHEEKAQRFGIDLFQHIADGEEVAQRLRHLLVVDIQEAVVHPVTGQRLAACSFALRDLVLVVRELQVGAAAMDVERVPQQRRGHGRAFDGPAGTTLAIGARPARVLGLVRLGGLPQHEIQRILLAVPHRDALARMQFVDRLARQLSVAGKFAHRVIDVAVVGPVGQSLVFEQADDLQHLRHVIGGARIVVGTLDAQRIGVAVHLLDHARGQRADGFTVLHRAPDDLVVDVGDVADIRDAQAASA